MSSNFFPVCPNVIHFKVTELEAHTFFSHSLDKLTSNNSVIVIV